jgi:MFS family permease
LVRQTGLPLLIRSLLSFPRASLVNLMTHTESRTALPKEHLYSSVDVLGCVYGHKTILLVGGVWFVICSLANGFTSTLTPFIIARALSGIGQALLMLNVVALIVSWFSYQKVNISGSTPELETAPS